MAYCSFCNCNTQAKEKMEKSSVFLQGEEVFFTKKMFVCQMCGREIFNDALTEENMLAAKKVYEQTRAARK